MSETLTDICKRLEHYETPEWAARAILEKEELTGLVIEPCVGTGILARAALAKNHMVEAIDIHDWGYRDGIISIKDYLKIGMLVSNRPFTIFMNPPFSKAVQFVEKSIELGASKIVCFQRFAWWESQARRKFWEAHPPARVYICGDRACCWRHDIPADQRGSSSPTAHAWFVWDNPAPKGTQLGHIYKGDA